MTSTDNPYASPQIPDAFQTPPAPAAMRIASQGKRFLNLIIDSFIIQFVSAAGGVALGVVFAVARMSNGAPITPQDEALMNAAGFVVGIAMSLAYFIVTEALFQRTIAKLVTGTLVVTPDGLRPSFGQIVGRSFARLIPFEAFSFLGGNQPVGWHDSLSGTRVIDIRRSA